MSVIPGYSVDDYAISFFGVNPASNLDKGRYTNAALELFLEAVGLNSYEAAGPSAFLLLFVMPLAIVVGAKYVLDGYGNLLFTSIGAAFIVAHPYFTEYLTFRQTIPGLLLLFLLMTLFFYQLDQYAPKSIPQRIRMGLILVFLVVLMVGLFQTALILIAIFLFAKFILLVTEGKNLRELGFELWVMLASSVTAFLMFKISLAVSGKAPEARTALIGLSELKTRLPDVYKQMIRLIIGEEPVLSSFTKILVMGMLIVVFWGLYKNSLKSLIFGVVFLAFGYPLACILPIVAGVWWPVPRVFFAISFVLGLFVVVSGKILSKQFARNISFVPLTVLLAFIFSSNEMLLDQQRVNRWDQWAVHQIVSDVSRANASGTDRLVIVGAHWAHPAPLGTIQGDMNTSALTVGYSIGSLFSETTGVVWNVSVEQNNIICDGASPWPTPDSYVFADDAVYVCMADRK